MNEEIEEQVQIETIRIESNALASNPTTSGKYLEILFAKKEEQDQLPDLRPEEWVTPESIEDLEKLIGNLT